MKILIHSINYAPELTGIGKYTGEMAEWLALRGYDVRVVTASPYYPLWQVQAGYSAWKYGRERVRGVNVWRCPFYVPTRPSGLRRILHLASFALSSLPVMLWHIFWRPDVVFVVEPPLFCAPMAWLIARLSNAKCWLHVQDFEVDAAFELGLLRRELMRRAILRAERALMRRFDKLSSLSSRMMQRLADKGGESSKLVYFPNWVDVGLIHPLDNASPFRKELGIPLEQIVVLYSGNMGEKQGLETVIGVARRLKNNRDLVFVLCGQGAAYERLRRMAEGLENICWLSLQPFERLNELLNLADIHLLTQRVGVEDLVMPSKLTGIFASGRPVVAAVEEGTEVWKVVQGKGITVPPGDAEALMAGIQALVQDPQLREQLGHAARDFAVDYLDRESVLVRFEKELTALVQV